MDTVQLTNHHKIKKYFAQLKPEIFKIQGHPLIGEEDYIQGLYVTMLSVVAQCEGLQETESIYLRRLLYGIGLELDLDKYLKQSLEVEQELVNEFVRGLIGHTLRYNFIVDALVMSRSGEGIKKEKLELIDEIGAILKITQEEMMWLNQLSLAILKQDNEIYRELVEIRPSTMSCKHFLYYLIEFVDGQVIDEEDYCYYTGEVYFKESCTFLDKEVIIENARITLEKGCQWLIKDCKKLRLSNVEIKSDKNNKDIKIYQTNEVVIQNLNIKHRNHKIFNIQECEKIYMENCTFKNIFDEQVTDNYNVQGGCMRIENCTQMTMIGCSFEKCGISVGHYYAKGGALYIDSLKEVKISDSSFEYCIVNSTWGSQCALGAAIYLQSVNNVSINKCKFYKCISKENNDINSGYCIGTESTKLTVDETTVTFIDCVGGTYKSKWDTYLKNLIPYQLMHKRKIGK